MVAALLGGWLAGTAHAAPAYVLDPFSPSSPDGLFALVLEQGPRLPIFGVGPGTVDLGWTDTGLLGQDMCVATQPLPTAAEGFAVAAVDVGVPDGPTLRGLTLQARPQPDALVDLGMVFWLDLAEVGPWLAVAMAEPAFADLDVLCASRTGTPGACATCPHDETAHTCVRVALHQASAPVSRPLVPVSADRCHPGCDASWDNPSCDTAGF